jgi:AmmeMemoRadiSam system protein B
VSHLLHGPAPAAPATVIGGVVPHAGYMYSGGVAAKFYLCLAEGSAPVVVIVSPSHREYFDGISVFRGAAYRTPLGDLGVDQQVADQLLSRGAPFVNSWEGHTREHALEVQLPFLQVRCPSILIVPVVMGDQRAQLCEALGEALADVLLERPALIVASSDLSHYHSHDEAQLLDRRVLQCVSGLDPQRLLDLLQRGEAEACGGGPIAAAMIAVRALGGTSGEILEYADSSAVSGDTTSVVGYLAAAFCRS